MAVALEAGFPVLDYSASDRTSITTSITVGSGASRLLLVFVPIEDAARSVSSVTFGGVNLTKLDASGATSWSKVECWYLVNPAASTANVVVNAATGGTAADHIGCVIYVFDGAHQTTPLRTAAKGSADTGTSTTHTVGSVASGDYTIDMVGIDGTAHAPAVGADQTADYATQSFGAGTNESRGSHQTTTDGAMSWTWTTSGPNSHLATAVIVAAGGGTQPISPAAISATSAVTASVVRKAAISLATINATSTVTAGVARLRPVGSAAIFATSTVSAAVVRLRALAGATIFATSTVSAAVTALHAITPAVVSSTSALTVSVTLAGVTPPPAPEEATRWERSWERSFAVRDDDDGERPPAGSW